MAQHGGKRAGAGRKPGKVSEAKRLISDKAKEHGDAALAVLVQVATTGESEGARIAAANAILDRAYGRPIQANDHTSSDGSMTPVAPVAIYELPDNGRGDAH